MNIKNKLSLLAGVPLAGLLIVFALAMIVVGSLRQAAEDIHDDSFRSLMVVNDVVERFQGQKALLARTPAEIEVAKVGDYRKDFLAKADEIDRLSADYAKTAHGDAAARFVKIQEHMRAYREKSEVVFASAEVFAQESAVNALNGPVAEVEKQLAGSLNEIKHLAQENARQQVADIQSEATSAHLVMIVLFIAVVAAGVVAAFRISVSILSPLRDLQGSIVAVEQGFDFSTRVKISSRDEVGQTAAAFNGLMESMQKAASEVNQIVAAIAAGDFGQRVNADLKGDLATMKDAVNTSARRVQLTMDGLNEVMKALYNGDFSARTMDADTQGQFRLAAEQAMQTLRAMQSMEQDIAGLVEAAAMGDYSQRVDLTDKRGFAVRLSQGVNRMMDSTEQGVTDVDDVLQAMAQGDLTHRMDGNYQGLFADLQNNANTMVEHLEKIIARIHAGTESVHVAAQEIAAGNDNLARRTEGQAGSLEETASSLEELTSAVQQNADSANQANQLVQGASEVAQKGGDVVAQVVTTMGNIAESSKKIADIIGVIDGIAFQTNILALNAAVEAARAGEQGRGFAVVASEVRSLAQRSAEAAKEIKQLISESVRQVEGGHQLVGAAGHTMQEIVMAVKRVADIMSEITAASNEQSRGITQVNSAVTQMDQMTQQNAALVEEATAAAESLQEQASEMAQAVATFKVNRQAAEKSAPLALPAPGFG